mmetsp:Transcript_2769/g.8140  ORF Transcript_2769/g.8140 Transcript_2769/m.8140 type:complete len:344 (+) Transcript_2769:131-1162(+)
MVSVSNNLPRFGLGLAALGRPGYINLNRDVVFGAAGTEGRQLEAMQNRADEVMGALVAECSKKGNSETGDSLTWFDCARSYGLSERFVGEYLRKRNVKPEDVYVSSKWGYTYVADWNVALESGAPHEVKDHSVDNFLKQLKETEKELGEYVNLYQVHSATFESGILSDERAHEALAKCREERGWSIGLSVSGTVQDDIIRTAMKIKTVDGDRLFDSVQCTFNMLEQKPGPALSEAHEVGMDIIIKEGMANGRVLKSDVIQSVAKRMGCNPDALALAAILAQPFQPRVLSGAVTPEQLTSNLEALELSKKLTSEDGKGILDEIMEGCRMESEQYWSDRSALSWN